MFTDMLLYNRNGGITFCKYICVIVFNLIDMWPWNATDGINLMFVITLCFLEFRV
jgi:hypothetical protein